MTTALSITITGPTGATPLAGKRVTLRGNDHAILGIGHTNASGVVAFNYPTFILGASIHVDGVGDSKQFNIPAAGSIVSAVNFPGNVQQISINDVWTVTDTAPTGSVTITGTPTVGSTLTAHNTLGDVDGMGYISYQWKAAGAVILGATGSTYVLTTSELTKVITVVASYTDGAGALESVTSAATLAVS